ncbi:chromosome partitioning protein [Solwaraspora sp. WMMD791]|uniref:MinD/ParA family ATP-binding protein n=1 Tax=Solwaraspora sp. WMMD791 TaxID=3016086 RepID=UPI00249A7CE3|nr:chromosome partitioning protein [Solwaraspora sp. WMMD791]WFE25829.1 chromosome partitioning protein [Solwaraspora sp. WMMD791]
MHDQTEPAMSTGTGGAPAEEPFWPPDEIVATGRSDVTMAVPVVPVPPPPSATPSQPSPPDAAPVPPPSDGNGRAVERDPGLPHSPTSPWAQPPRRLTTPADTDDSDQRSGGLPPAPRRSPEQPAPAEQFAPESAGRSHPSSPRPGPTHPSPPHPGPSRPAPPPGQTPTPPPPGPPPSPPPPGPPASGPQASGPQAGQAGEPPTAPAPAPAAGMGQPADPWAPADAGPPAATGWDDWTPADGGGWSPPQPMAYQQVVPGVTELPRQPYEEAPGVHRIPSPPAPPQPGPQQPHLAPQPHPQQPTAPRPGPTPQQPVPPAAGYPPAAGPGYPHPPAVSYPVPPAVAGPYPPAPPHVQPDPHAGWVGDGFAPTAEEFAQRRAVKPANPVATMGMRAALNRTTLGLVKLPPGQQEQEIRRDIEMVRRNFGGLRQVTVVNPKGGAGKTVAILMLAMTFGQKRGGYVLAWDNNETQGTLGMRAQQDFHSRTVRDMLRDLRQFQGAHGRVGDLSQYVRAQGEGMFDVLASDESATAGEMLTAAAFAEIREVVSRFYKLIFVDTGNNVRAQNWQAAIDATDQLVVTMSARNDSAEPAARMLDHLEQTGRQRLVRQAVTVISMPPSRREIDLRPIEQHFAARTRTVLLAPYERIIDSGEPIRYGQLSSTFRQAWLKIAAAVSDGL